VLGYVRRRRIGHYAPMSVNESDFPEDGIVTIEWNVRLVDGLPRLGWSYRADPTLDPRLAIALLTEVATELKEDLPS
jgi:hypothetical protein